jgi:ribose transport system substrate-binding protein
MRKSTPWLTTACLLTSIAAPLASAASARADELNLTKAEHTPLPCDSTLTVEMAASFKAPKAKKPYKIEVSIPSLANPYIVALYYGAELAAADAGVTLGLDAGKGFQDPASQITVLENAMTHHPDAVLINPAEPDGLVATIDDIVDSGVPVIDVGTLSNSTKSDKLVQDDYSQGLMAAQALGKLLPAGGGGIVLGGPAASSFARRRVAGFLDGLQKLPKIQISALTNQDINPAEGLIKFTDAAQAHPKVDWIYAVGSFLLPPPSIPAEYHKSVYVAGSLTTVTEDALKDGGIAAVLPDFPITVGYVGVALAVQKLNGEKIPHYSCAPVSAMTKADLGQPVWAKTSIVPENWTPPSNK